MITSWFKQNPIPAFFGMTFFLAWSLWLPLGIFAPQHYFLSLPGAWSPTLSAVILTWIDDGGPGLRQLLRRVIHWRVGLQWYLVVLFGIAAIAYLAIGVGLVFGVPAPVLVLPYELPGSALIGLLPIFFLTNIFVGGPIAEDIGWRGYLLPKLRERLSTFNASLLIGLVWAVWHLPFFIFPTWRGIVGNVPFLGFALLTTSWSVLFAWVYVNTESILMPILFHAAINTTLGTLGILGQLDGNLTPLVLNIFLTWVAAGIIVAVFGTDLKRRPLTARQVS